jgi:hypothetical protein
MEDQAKGRLAGDLQAGLGCRMATPWETIVGMMVSGSGGRELAVDEGVFDEETTARECGGRQRKEEGERKRLKCKGGL